MRYFSAALASLSLLALSVPVSAHADEASRLLERMSQAAHSKNYIGTFVYLQQDQIESMRLIHGVDKEGRERERLVSLSGPNREVIREEGKVKCYLPKNEMLVANQPDTPIGFPINLPAHWEQLSEVYDFKVVGQARVAGLDAQHIAIIPRDKLRYGQNFWVENQSGLLLRADIVDVEGNVVEQLEFTSLEVLPSIPESQLQPVSQFPAQTMKSSMAREQISQPESPSHWQVTNLPAGFSLEVQRQHHINDGKKSVEHLIYSDGLSSVSIFIEPWQKSTTPSSRTDQRGSVNIYSHVSPDNRITVLGEVPMDTVKQIGESIEHLGQ